MMRIEKTVHKQDGMSLFNDNVYIGSIFSSHLKFKFNMIYNIEIGHNCSIKGKLI